MDQVEQEEIGENLTLDSVVFVGLVDCHVFIVLLDALVQDEHPLVDSNDDLEWKAEETEEREGYHDPVELNDPVEVILLEVVQQVHVSAEEERVLITVNRGDTEAGGLRITGTGIAEVRVVESPAEPNSVLTDGLLAWDLEDQLDFNIAEVLRDLLDLNVELTWIST